MLHQSRLRARCVRAFSREAGESQASRRPFAFPASLSGTGSQSISLPKKSMALVDAPIAAFHPEDFSHASLTADAVVLDALPADLPATNVVIAPASMLLDARSAHGAPRHEPVQQARAARARRAYAARRRRRSQQPFSRKKQLDKAQRVHWPIGGRHAAAAGPCARSDGR